VRELLGFLTAVREELVQRRIEQADGDGEAVHRLEDPLEVAALHGQQLFERTPPPPFVARDDHLAHRGDAVAFEEHVLGAAQPDALGAEGARDAGVARRVGVGAHLEPPHSSSAQPMSSANAEYTGASASRCTPETTRITSLGSVGRSPGRRARFRRRA
jgi:hypothetical protein